MVRFSLFNIEAVEEGKGTTSVRREGRATDVRI